MRFAHFVSVKLNFHLLFFSHLDVQAIILAYYFLFIRVEIHCCIWVSQVYSTYKANYLCHLWFAIAMIFWVFAQTFIDQKSVWYAPYANDCNPQKKHTKVYLLSSPRGWKETQNYIIIATTSMLLFSLPLNVLRTLRETRWECITKRKIASDVYACV